jgi:hypothetical protein
MNRSRLYLLILIAFILAAVAFLLYRWANFAEEHQKIYGAVRQENAASWSSSPRNPFRLEGRPAAQVAAELGVTGRWRIG